MSDILTIAEQYISAGLKCIPIHYAQKRPRNAKWSKEFLTFQQFKSHYQSGDGLGVVTGHCSMLFCIDIDQKSGGLIWYESKKDLLGNPLIERTPGGGYHLYYQYPDGFQYIPSSNNYAPGVEIKADGGRQVVTAPSEKPSGKYTIENNLTLLDIVEFDFPPKWILDELFEKQRTTLALDPKLVTDIEPDLEGAIKAITKMEPAKAGDGGDNKTYVAACKCRDYGLNQVMAYALLKEHFNPKCNPPWSDKELKQKVNNAYNYGLNALGAAVREKPTPLQPLVASAWLADPIVEANPILNGVFDSSDKVVIIGQSKTRKSFFTLQLALQIAAGRKFLHFDGLDKKRVLIVQFEIKKDRYHARCKRMVKKLNLDAQDLDQLGVINARGFRGTSEDLTSMIKKQADDFKPDVIILDPLYKLITGDESKSEDIKVILSFFDYLAESTGAAVVYVHHDKKGVSGDQQLTDRGSGSGVLARDFDSAIFLSPHKDQEQVLVVEFIARNYPEPKKLSIQWDDGAFILSNASCEKATLRSNQSKRAKTSELVEKAKKVIKDILKFGNSEIGMMEFNERLQDSGIPKNSLSGIKEILGNEGVIEKVQNPRKSGKPNITVVLVREKLLLEEISNDSSEIREEIEDYLETPF